MIANFRRRNFFNSNLLNDCTSKWVLDNFITLIREVVAMNFDKIEPERISQLITQLELVALDGGRWEDNPFVGSVKFWLSLYKLVKRCESEFFAYTDSVLLNYYADNDKNVLPTPSLTHLKKAHDVIGQLNNCRQKRV